MIARGVVAGGEEANKSGLFGREELPATAGTAAPAAEVCDGVAATSAIAMTER